MKYFETLIEDQETTISILYQEQMIRVYSSEPHVIQRLSKALGRPTQKYLKSKAYWSGASWDIDFFALEKIQSILVRDIFIDKKIKPIVREEKKKTKKAIEKNNKKKEILTKKKENSRTKKETAAKNVVKKEKIKKEVKIKEITKKAEPKKEVPVKKATKKAEPKKEVPVKNTSKKKVSKSSEKEKLKFEQIQFTF